MKHVEDAIAYWVENASENMCVPFIITLKVEYDRAYCIEGTNVFANGELCIICRQYIEEIDKTIVRHLGNIFANEYDYSIVYSLILKDLKENPIKEQL